MDYLIGLDIGTSSIKAALYDVQGNMTALQTGQTKLLTPDSYRTEIDMETLWIDCARCIKELLSLHVSCSDSILGIGVTGQGEGLWLIDEKGNPVQNAVLWCDRRSSSVIDSLSEEQKKMFKSITLHDPLPASTAIQLKWFAEHHPDVLAKAATVFNCKDWIRYKLTERRQADYTDTSVTMLDIKKQQYSKTLLDLLGLSEYETLLPALLHSTEKAGEITEKAAKITGLPCHTPVAAGSLDVAATSLGVNASKAGDIFLILGTTACIGRIETLEKMDAKKGRYILHPHQKFAIQIMAAMSGTPNIEWMRNHISNYKNFEYIEQEVEKSPPGSGGVIYHPYISHAGERFPFYSPNAKAGFFGISLASTQSDIIRSVFEGVAFSIKDCLQEIDSEGPIRIAGGGSHSLLWPQIIADCTGRQVFSSGEDEFGVKGAAIMASVCAGVHGDLKTACEVFSRGKTVLTPCSENQLVYNDLFRLFKQLRINHLAMWDERQQILNKHNL